MTDTIFMIHGMWAKPHVWEAYAGVFTERGYRCVRPTLRYHDIEPGERPDPRLGTTSLQDYADDLEEEIERLGGRPIVMGHSMGGLLAQMLAARGLAKAAVLLTPAPPAGILMVHKPSVIKTFWRIQTQWGFWRKPVRLGFEESVYSTFHLLPQEEQRRTYDEFVWESGRAVWEIGMWFLDRHGAARVDETAVSSPVLVIGGGKDRMVPPSVVRRVASKYEDVATYKEYPSHTQWIVEEPGWEDVAADVVAWLERVSVGDLPAR